MIPGTPEEARWLRAEPRRTISAALVERIIRIALPGRSVVRVEALTDGLRNANFKLQLDSSPGLVVLRIYEHDRSLCQKELDILRLLRGSVPVPEVLYADPQGNECGSPFAVLEYVEGISFHALKRNEERKAIAQAASSAGATLASIGRFTFLKAGWLAAGPTVTSPLLEGENPLPRFVDLCLECAHLQRRLDSELRDRIHLLFWRCAPQLARQDNELSLVHCDFGKRNLLVRKVAGTWSVVSVLDWEFAVSGAPLIDVGHFLRYECISRPVLEPHFSTGFLQTGGKLPQDWRGLARVIDLSALCESLTHDQLPESAETELIELVRATVENRDPHLP